ncbi:MAG: hypothetical protein DMG06_30915 [Acidobacteria bacterium]|nr:MAG: hypothetical protein DMG06_30915 [Acidobacteriota bacterium]
MSSCITLSLLIVTVFGHFAFGADPTRSADCSASLNWLRSQIVPNRQVPTPHPQRRGLILSYAPGQGQKGPLYDKSFVYDAAAGAIALVVASDWGNAAKILDALVRVQREDGSFWFSYSSQNDWPNEIDHDMAVVRTGVLGQGMPSASICRIVLRSPMRLQRDSANAIWLRRVEQPISFHDRGPTNLPWLEAY